MTVQYSWDLEAVAWAGIEGAVVAVNSRLPVKMSTFASLTGDNTDDTQTEHYTETSDRETPHYLNE